MRIDTEICSDLDTACSDSKLVGVELGYHAVSGCIVAIELRDRGGS